MTRAREFLNGLWPNWAGVSLPFTWDELENIYPGDFNISNAPSRLGKVGDVWADILKSKKPLKVDPSGSYTVQQDRLVWFQPIAIGPKMVRKLLNVVVQTYDARRKNEPNLGRIAFRSQWQNKCGVSFGAEFGEKLFQPNYSNPALWYWVSRYVVRK